MKAFKLTPPSIRLVELWSSERDAARAASHQSLEVRRLNDLCSGSSLNSLAWLQLLRSDSPELLPPIPHQRKHVRAKKLMEV